jgi:uncharacterized protein YgbK (DUF1537 family)
MKSPDFLLADDLSGALEAAAAFRAHGWRVSVPLRTAPPLPGWLTMHSTETRNRRPAAAAVAVARLLRAERRRGARLLFKKIDSTLRGPVAAEITAVLDTLDPPLVVVCPANPAVGRTVRDGVLRVHGVPVAETEFARDPGWPVTRSDVAGWLEAGGVPVVAGRLNAATRGVFVADAATTEDLRRVVAAARAVTPEAVFVGSGALASAVAETVPLPAGWPYAGADATTALPRPVLVLCGSKHPLSRRQVERVPAVAGWPLILVDDTSGGVADAARTIGAALAGQGGVAVLALVAGFRPSRVAPLRQLWATLEAVCATAVPASLVITGGETAHLMCRHLGIRALEPWTQFEPGLVGCHPSGGPAGLRCLVTKPGGFGDDDTWVRLLASRPPIRPRRAPQRRFAVQAKTR